MLQTISSALPWNWGSSSSPKVHHTKLKKKHPTTRREQLAANGHANPHSKEESEDDWETPSYYPGLVNVSGTYCFMNSTMQAFASLSYLQPYVDAIHDKAEALDVPTPVTDALRDLLHALNTPKFKSSAIRPIPMIEALSHPEPGKRSPLFSSREHQDAQELFQLVSEYVKKEATAVDKESLRDLGLRRLPSPPLWPHEGRKQLSTSVFDGWTANRRSCVECGYTEAVMHFPFDNWQLSVPRSSMCTLHDCLNDYTRIEILTDCICRKCSMLATHARLDQEAKRLTELTESDPKVSSSKKKRAREARKFANRVKEALDQGRIEEDIKDVKMEKVFSKVSTKQAMIARPPPVLALHLNRSMHFGGYAAKNSTAVRFPEILDLTPFTTSGKLSTLPSAPISTPDPSTSRNTVPFSPPSSQDTYHSPARIPLPAVLYRLSAVVCHYGQHSYGHYVCYRRKPRPPSKSSDPSRRFAPPMAPHPFGCQCSNCLQYGMVRDSDEPQPGRPGTGKGWMRISDDSVRECGVEEALAEGSGAFMLYYERIVEMHPRPLKMYSLNTSTSPSSSETVTPRMKTEANGYARQAQDGPSPREEHRVGPRVVRNVATRSPSVTSVDYSQRGKGKEADEGTRTPRAVSIAETESLASDSSNVFTVPSSSTASSISSLPSSTSTAGSSPTPKDHPPQSSSSPPQHTASTPLRINPPEPSSQPDPVARSSSSTSQISPARVVGLRA